MPFIKCLAIWSVLTASLAAQGAIDKKAAEEDLKDADFVARAWLVLNEIEWAFPGHHEVAISYKRYGHLDMRVQFPVMSGDECRLRMWFVPGSELAVYDQLLEIREKAPDTSPEDAVRALKTVRRDLSIPCESELARLLGRARDFSVRFVGDDGPREAIYFDAPTNSVDLRLGNLRVTLAFPSSLDSPMAIWVADVREAILTYIDRGLKIP